MKKVIILVFSVSIVLFGACGNSENTDSQVETVQEGKAELEQLCFMEVNENEPFESEGQTYQFNDSAYVFLIIDTDNNVVGEYNWLPAEKDSRRAIVKGKLVDGKIEAMGTFSAEGDVYDEPVTFEIDATEITITEASKAVFKLRKVDCQ